MLRSQNRNKLKHGSCEASPNQAHLRGSAQRFWQHRRHAQAGPSARSCDHSRRCGSVHGDRQNPGGSPPKRLQLLRSNSGGVLGKQEVRPSSTFHSCDTKLEAASQGRACTSAQLTLTNEHSPGSAAAPPGAAAAARQVEDAATNHGVVERELEAGEQGAHHRLRSTARSHTLV